MNPDDLDQQPAPQPATASAQHIGQVAVPHPVETADRADKPPQSLPASAPDSGNPPSAPQSSNQPPTEDKTIKLPVSTSAVPAILIGLLIVVMLLAVVAYAFFS